MASWHEPADYIYVYSRADAIRDGTLVPLRELVPDEPDFARRTGWRPTDVCLTSALAKIVVPTKREAHQGQSVKGRLWDVLLLGAHAARRTPEGTEVTYLCSFRMLDRHVKGGHATYRLKAVSHAGDRGEPCLTLMLADED